jgi:hypothetical protein
MAIGLWLILWYRVGSSCACAKIYPEYDRPTERESSGGEAAI